MSDPRQEKEAASTGESAWVDLNLEQSFPASDPPAWTLGYAPDTRGGEAEAPESRAPEPRAQRPRPREADAGA